jgi:inosine-uridine nucleoside N-ribohydrolase
MLLALASSPEDLEIMMISVTYGNVPLENCMRNVVGLFKVLGKEMDWRKAQGKPLGFENLRTFKPIVALGPEHALEDEILMADNFREPLQDPPAVAHDYKSN